MPFGAILGAIGAIGGAAISAGGAQSAADTQANAANAAAQVQQNEFNTTQHNLAPYMAAGGNALSVLQSLLGIPGSAAPAQGAAAPAASAGGLPAGYSLQPSYGQVATEGARGTMGTSQGLTGYNVMGPNGAMIGTVPVSGNPQTAAAGLVGALGGNVAGNAPGAGVAPTAPTGNALTDPRALMGTSFQSSPGYQFALNQAMGAVTNSAAARGGIGGGNTLAALQHYGVGLANQDYYNWLGDYFGQANNYVGQVGNMAQLGQNSAVNVGSQGNTAMNNIGNSLMGAGNARAAGTMGVANALTNGIQNIDWSAILGSNNGGGGGYSNAWGY